MLYNTQFAQPKDYVRILRDSYKENVYYGLDNFDARYLKIIQSKFGCTTSYHTIPDHVKMEMAPYEWHEKRQKYVLIENKRMPVQVNQLENLVISYNLTEEI